MSNLIVFRILLLAFVVVYLTAMNSSAISGTLPAEALQYEEWAKAQPVASSVGWGVLCLLGHLFDLVGLILLLLQRRTGVFFLLAGFASCLGAGSSLPYLQTSLTGNLFAITNIIWGAIITMSFVVPKELFHD